MDSNVKEKNRQELQIPSNNTRMAIVQNPSIVVLTHIIGIRVPFSMLKNDRGEELLWLSVNA